MPNQEWDSMFPPFVEIYRHAKNRNNPFFERLQIKNPEIWQFYIELV